MHPANLLHTPISPAAWHTGAMQSKPNPKPLLILLHGTCLNGGQWALYRDLLADAAEIAAPDLPGHGVHAHTAFSLDAAVQAVHEQVCQAQPRQQPVILGGHSLGGFVAMSYAERHPDQLAGLILIGSATEPGGPGAIVYRAVARLWEMAGPQRVQQLHEHTLGRMADARVWNAVQARGESFGAVREAWAQVMQHCGSRQLRQVRCRAGAGRATRSTASANQALCCCRAARASHYRRRAHPPLAAHASGRGCCRVAQLDCRFAHEHRCGMKAVAALQYARLRRHACQITWADNVSQGLFTLL